MNDWLELAPEAQPACSDLGAMVSTPCTADLFKKLAALKPQRLAIMHGSSFDGDGFRALEDLAVGFREIFGGAT